MEWSSSSAPWIDGHTSVSDAESMGDLFFLASEIKGHMCCSCAAVNRCRVHLWVPWVDGTARAPKTNAPKHIVKET